MPDACAYYLDFKKLVEAYDRLRPDWDKRTTEEWLAEFLQVSGVILQWKHSETP